jgi:tRNA-splicing ligase RtcB
MKTAYQLTQPTNGVPIKSWTHGVPVEPDAMAQLSNIARLPVVHRWVAAMPDVHLGIGATVGSVIPTLGAIIPAAVGVDIGCGMMALQTTLTASDLPESLAPMRGAIERAVPHGRGRHGGKGDVGSWDAIPNRVRDVWSGLELGWKRIVDKHPAVEKVNHVVHLGTLGTGNHFIEVCLDEADKVWIMLHSGSRGVGNRIGSYFIELAKKDMSRHMHSLPDENLAYFKEGSEHFDDYVEAVSWAQAFARHNRELMMHAVLDALRRMQGIPPFQMAKTAVNCHHNYVAREHHYGKDVFLTRKGAVRAGKGELGIIPGSMGARSYIVRGLGNAESFESCSHGAGRVMSRTAAKKRFTIEDHKRATAGVECRKDKDVIDETPMAYKDIDAVMEAQRDLVEVVHTLKQVLCVKG